MGSGSLDVAHRWIEELEKGNPAPELCAEEIVISNSAEFPINGSYSGREGVVAWWNDLAEAFDQDLHFGLIELHELDDERVLTTQRLVGTFRLTGLEFDVPWGSIITVRDGEIMSAEGYSTPKLAKRAAGLED
jgi:ketosteroid isomerase-like protein